MLTSDKFQDWSTPLALFAGLQADYQFTIDACALEGNAKLDRYVTEQMDMFKHDFSAERVFCNPPFGMIGPVLDLSMWWCRRKTGPAIWTNIVPANIETDWYLDKAVHGYKETFKRRVAFTPPIGYVPPIDPKTGKPKKMNSPSFASILVSYGLPGTGLGFGALRCGKTGVLLSTEQR